MTVASEQRPSVGTFFSDKFVYLVLPFLTLGPAFELYAGYLNEKHHGQPDAVEQIIQLSGLGSPTLLLAGEKLIDVCVTLLFYYLLRRHRTRFYRPGLPDFRSFITTFLYGRPLSTFQMFYSLPKLFPLLLFGLGINALGFSYSYYAGYNLVAGLRGWKTGPTVDVVGFPLDPMAIVAAVGVTILGAQLLWQDYEAWNQNQPVIQGPPPKAA